MTDQAPTNQPRRRIGEVDARYMTHPERTHSSGDPCPVGPFPHRAQADCLDPERSYVISTETIAEQAAREADHPAATLEPWTDDDTPTARAIQAHIHAIRRDRWTEAQRGAGRYRVDRGAAFRLTTDELATAAARFGIVADGEALPLNSVRRHPTSTDATDRRAEAIARQRETSDVWIVAARHYRHRDTYTATFRDGPDRAHAGEVLRGEALPFAEYLDGIVLGAALARFLANKNADRWPILTEATR